jgi:haloalkane dehalogenase
MADDSWVDRTLYPFAPHHLEVDGGRMHYLDEGSGPAVVMVHGTPTWSFLYRDLITALSSSYRVIAPDNLGFGLSDKPARWGYTPADHAKNLSVLVDHLDLDDFVLVVHDFGGPIGLSLAIEQPQRVRGLVLFNTWMWSLAGTRAEKMSHIMATGFGRFLYTRLNLSPRALIPAAFGDRKALTRDVHRHYIRPFGAPAERIGAWTLARELGASGPWYEDLWQRREAITDKPALLLWGMKDPAFGPEALDRWRGEMLGARIVELPEAGHFVQEEAPERAAAEVRTFLGALD